MNGQSKPGRGWRILRRILISLAILATLVAALYTEEDWRGKHDWETYKHKWEAKGEKFEWQAFVPPSVPDDQNFFTAPIFTNLLDGKIDMVPYGKDGGPSFRSGTSRSGYAVNRMYSADLEAWQYYYRNPTNLHAVHELVMTNGVLMPETNLLNHAPGEFPVARQPQTPAKDVLLALSKYDSAVEELRQASRRPYACIPLNYANGFNTGGTLYLYLADLKRCTQLLQLRAAAELADGQNAKALDDVSLLLYLDNSLRNSPFLISELVRMAMLEYLIQPIWEGLAEHKWSDDQLVSLNVELGKMDFPADYEFTMRGERAFAIASLENQRLTRQVIVPLEKGGSMTIEMRWVPSAYFYQNELAIARVQQDWILPLVNTNARVVSPAAMRRVEAAASAARKHYSLYKTQAMMLVPALEAAARLFSIAQTSIDLARVACALERYRLAHGRYPETLDALTPQFIEKLPHDIINGQPLHYRRTADGQFVLYSVGWNETDDGGTVVLRKGNSNVDSNSGDWVWEYPAN